MTYVTTAVLVRGTPGAAANPIDVLVALAAVLGKVNASPEHAADVCVSLVKALLHNGVYEGAAVEEHSLVGLRHHGARCGSGGGAAGRRLGSRCADLLRDFLAPVGVAFPQLSVLHFLYLKSKKQTIVKLFL